MRESRECVEIKVPDLDVLCPHIYSLTRDKEKLVFSFNIIQHFLFSCNSPTRAITLMGFSTRLTSVFSTASSRGERKYRFKLAASGLFFLGKVEGQRQLSLEKSR